MYGLKQRFKCILNENETLNCTGFTSWALSSQTNLSFLFFRFLAWALCWVRVRAMQFYPMYLPNINDDTWTKQKNKLLSKAFLVNLLLFFHFCCVFSSLAFVNISFILSITVPFVESKKNRIPWLCDFFLHVFLFGCHASTTHYFHGLLLDSFFFSYYYSLFCRFVLTSSFGVGWVE